MPGTYREIVHALREKVILDAAKTMIANDGCRAFSTTRLATAVGLGKGTIYVHFPSQEAAIEAALADAGKGMIEAMEGMDSIQPEQRLLLAVSTLLTLLRGAPRGTLAGPCCFSCSPCPFKGWAEVEDRLQRFITAWLSTPRAPRDLDSAFASRALHHMLSAAAQKESESPFSSANLERIEKAYLSLLGLERT